jgi:WD40 repeat protein
MLLACAAYNTVDCLESRRALQRTLETQTALSRFLYVPQGNVVDCAFGPDGRLAVAHTAGVILFDTNDQRISTSEMEVKEGSIAGVALGPDEQIVAAFNRHVEGDDQDHGGVVVFDSGGKRINSEPIDLGRTTVSSLAVSHDGRIAAGSWELLNDQETLGTVHFFGSRGEHVNPGARTVKEGGVTSVEFSPDGLLAATYDKGMVIFDAEGKRVKRDTAAWDKALAYFASRDQEVKKSSSELQVDDRSAAVSPDGRFARGYDSGVAIFEPGPKRGDPARMPVPEGEVTGLASGPDGLMAAGYGVREASGKSWGGVVVFDARGQRVHAEPLKVNDGAVRCVAFGPHGRIAAGCEISGKEHHSGVVVFDARGERVGAAAMEVKEGQITKVAFCPDGRIAAGFLGPISNGKLHGGVLLFQANGQRVLSAPLEAKPGVVHSMSFGPDGLLAAGFDYGVELFNAQGQRLTTQPMEAISRPVNRVAFISDGRIAADFGEELVVFNTDATRSGAIHFPADFTTDFTAIGPDRFTLPSHAWATLADARWEPLTPVPLSLPLPRSVEHGQSLYGNVSLSDVTFVPGRRLAAAVRISEYNRKDRWEVAVFNIDPTSWQRTIERTANRNFTWAEWRRFFPRTQDAPVAYRRTVREFDFPHDLPETEKKKAQDWEREHPEQTSAVTNMREGSS